MMTLTASQEEKEQELVHYIREGEKRIVLKGSAGTGKTFLTNHLIYMLKTELYRWGVIYVTAPTHKALAVLKTKIDPKPYIKFMTIHSALQLRRQIDYKTGQQYFVRGKVNPKYPPFQSAQIVLLDEASMIGSDILAHINEFPNLTFLFLGDPEQLNPVGEDTSPVFVKDYPTAELTEIIRQGEGNPIIELSRNLNRIPSKVDCITSDGQGYFYDNNRDVIIDRLAKFNGSDDIKYLAWTNDDVDQMNMDVRTKIYGNPAKVELGESLIFASPFGDFTNNEEIKVEKLEVIENYLIQIPDQRTQLNFNDGVGSIKEIVRDGEIIPTYQTSRIKVYLVNDCVRILHEESEEEFKYHMNQLRSDCKTGLVPWPLFFWFSEQFAQITYNHAITVHKSQGSTYKIAVMNVANLMRNKNASEKKKLLYTAVTRASQKVCLFNVR